MCSMVRSIKSEEAKDYEEIGMNNLKRQMAKLKGDIMLYPVVQRSVFTPIDEERVVCAGFDEPIIICDVDVKRLAVLEQRRVMRAKLKRKRKAINH